MTDYSVVVVGTDGSSLAEPTVARAAWLAKHEGMPTLSSMRL